MSKITDAIAEFLENGGTALGYDDMNLPLIKDFGTVLDQSVKMWEYFGFESEDEFYAISKGPGHLSEGKTL